MSALDQRARRRGVQHGQPGAVGDLHAGGRDADLDREKPGHGARPARERPGSADRAADGAEHQFRRQVVAAVVDHGDQVPEARRVAQRERTIERRAVLAAASREERAGASGGVVGHAPRRAQHGDAARLQELLTAYERRFIEDFYAYEPPRDKPGH